MSEREDANGDGYIGEFSRDYINAEIFKLFDQDGSGKITKSDLDEVARQMGWDAKQSKLSFIVQSHLCRYNFVLRPSGGANFRA